MNHILFFTLLIEIEVVSGGLFIASVSYPFLSPYPFNGVGKDILFFYGCSFQNVVVVLEFLPEVVPIYTTMKRCYKGSHFFSLLSAPYVTCF